MTDVADKRARKKRKLDGKNSLKIGNHVISLEGYLTAPPPKAAPPIETTPKTETDLPDDPESAKPDAPRRPTRQTKRGNGPNSGRERSQNNGPANGGRGKSAAQNNGHDKTGPTDDEKLLRTRQKLPIWPHRDEIREALRKPGQDVLVLVGETGSGKSTQVPQFLYQEEWCQRRKVKVRRTPKASQSDASTKGEGEEDMWVGGLVAVTQPRRVAATTLAHRVAAEAGTPLDGRPKGQVGYSVRFDHRVPNGARIKYMTEGMLLQELLQDADLRQYSVVVVDEIHERGIDVDLLVGFLKQIVDGDGRGRGGVPLKVVVMSATADVDVIKNFFSSGHSSPSPSSSSLVQVMHIQGRQHPVDIIHAPKPVADIQDTLLKTIFKIHMHEPLPGDILAFLTGQEEIEAAQKLVDEYAATLGAGAPRLVALPLFGQLSIEAQHAAFRPVPADPEHPNRPARKVVLATNIAETSVTVPGVRFVIDCGKAKIKKFHVRLGMESLLAREISKSSAVQRAGRAGREAPGKCYRLYTADSHAALADADLPEILRTDVLGAVLTMKARGIDDVLAFPLMSVPDTEALERALLQLHFLGAIDGHGKITPQGRQMALLPVSALFARVLLAASRAQEPVVLEAIDVISCLTAGEDIFLHVHSEDVNADAILELRRQLRRREGDLLTYLTAMQMYATTPPAERTAWCHARRINARNMRQAFNIRRQLRALSQRIGLISPPDDDETFIPLCPTKSDALLRCFVRGFALRTAVLAPDASYVSVRGKQPVAVHPSSVLHGEKREAILFLEYVYTTKNYAKRVSAIRAAWIAEALEGAMD